MNGHDLGLVLGPGPQGHCDDQRLGGAIVDHDAVSGLWRMWYYCRDRSFSGPPTLGTGRIAHAVSHDGAAWRRVDGPLAGGAVFAPSADASDFDSLHVGLTDVSRGAGEWLMWYFGGDHAPRTATPLGAVPGLGMRPGLARSGDGVHWERVRGHDASGALVGLPEQSLYAAWPNALHDGREWLMQVTEASADLSRFDTRLWASGDLRHWRDEGLLRWANGERPFDAAGMVTRQLLANPLPGGRRFLMIYTAVDAVHRRAIAAADSDDGRVWHRLYDRPIFTVGAPGAWDSLGVAATRLLVANGRFYFYYYGFQSLGDDGGRRGIGLATAPLDDLRLLRRWSASPPGEEGTPDG